MRNKLMILNACKYYVSLEIIYGTSTRSIIDYNTSNTTTHENENYT